MREVNVQKITEAVKSLCMKAAIHLPPEVWKALKEARARETSPTGQSVLDQIMENDRISEAEGIPMCQDTGITVVHVALGQDCHVTGGDITQAIIEGVRQGYGKGYLRSSIVAEPLFERKNTGDNTPPVIHCQIVSGDGLAIGITPKGGGAENMSALKILPPHAGLEGVKKFVLETIKSAGSNPCPPVIAGVGIGSNFEGVAALAKKAIIRPIGSHHPDPRYAALEKELLEMINATGIGPQGLGGINTALAVHIETYPCHITAIPVAINIQCHAARHEEIKL